jgi:hypothetical protein
MAHKRWLQAMKHFIPMAWFGRYEGRRADRRPVPCRPSLEMLESRTLLTVVTVDRLTDNASGSGGEGGNGMGDLRWCVEESLFRADTIDFSVNGTIHLAASLPTLTRNVSIEGPGAELMTVGRSAGSFRILTVPSGVTASISGLTITDGGISNAGARQDREPFSSGWVGTAPAAGLRKALQGGSLIALSSPASVPSSDFLSSP